MIGDEERPGLVTDWWQLVKLMAFAIGASSVVGLVLIALLWVLAWWLV